MGEHDTGEGNCADIFGADIIAFLCRRQQRMQHLDRRLEHFDEFENALVGAVEAAREAVGIGIVLGEALELANVDLADEGGNVLVVLVAGFGLRDGDLTQARRIELHHAEAGDVATEFVEPLEAPGAHQAAHATTLDVIPLLEERSHLFGIEEAERALEDRADLFSCLEDIDGIDFHQRLQSLGQRRLATADRTEQIKDLLALLEALRRMAEECDDLLDRLFHPIKFREGRIGSDRPVHKDPAQPRVLRRVDCHRFADRQQQAFGRARII